MKTLRRSRLEVEAPAAMKIISLRLHETRRDEEVKLPAIAHVLVWR